MNKYRFKYLVYKILLWCPFVFGELRAKLEGKKAKYKVLLRTNKHIYKADNGNTEAVYKYTLPEKMPEYEEAQPIEGIPEVKLIAFFLPQFHTIPENDEWWGEGFTEWTNTKKSTPRFDGHYQPRTPHKDIGYYDLSKVETLKRQARMAKAHGIYGFCFYYYWFSGKTLLEHPINMLLDHPEIDLPFCLCWANENWTRRWDGQDNEILIKQEYNQNDPVRFIDDLKKCLMDNRYIKIEGKPVILVYCPERIPDIDVVFNTWRERAREFGIGELLIWTCQVFGKNASYLGIVNLIDGEVQFPPHNIPYADIAVNMITDKVTSEIVGRVYNYSETVDAIIKKNSIGDDVPLYKTCTLQWDNASRRKMGFMLFVNYSLTALYKWTRHNIEHTLRHNEHKYAFINAWNEWAEGTYLEPDEKYGYANINTISKALCNVPIDDNSIKKKSYVLGTGGNLEDYYLKYRQLRFKYVTYKVLSKITWGKWRYCYKQKRIVLKQKLKHLQGQFECSSKIRENLREFSEKCKETERRIIYVTHDAFFSGAQLLSLNIVRQLQETFGYSVYVIVTSLSSGELLEQFKEAATDVLCIEADIINMTELEQWVRGSKIKKAMFNTVVTGNLLKVLSQCGVSCISMIHEMENVIRQRSCEGALQDIVGYAKKIVFPSNYAYESVSQVTNIPQELIVLQPQGIYSFNEHLENREEIRRQIRLQHDLPTNVKIVLGVGYGDYRKGLDIFVRCAVDVCANDSNAAFIWVGAIDTHGTQIKQRIDDILSSATTEVRLILVGQQSVASLMHYYASADVFLLTSREDPFPAVVLDAMNAYLPAIAFEGGGGYVDIVTGRTGALVPMEDAAAMTQEILSFLKSGELRELRGQVAHNVVAERFNFIGYVYFLLNLLDESYKKISVIIPNYNYAKYLPARIESVLNQTYPIFEIFILDDCSSDESLSIIKQYQKRYPLRIKVLQNQVNSGNVFSQWSKGLEVAQGDYVWIAEADDLADETFLETLMLKMSSDDDITLGYTQSRAINEDGVVIMKDYLEYTNDVDAEIYLNDYVADGHEEIAKRLSIKNTIPNISAVLMKNRNFQTLIENASTYKIAGDWRFYVDLLMNEGKVLYVAKSLNSHRRHSESVTKTLQAQKHFDEICDVQQYIADMFLGGKLTDNVLEYKKKVKALLLG